MATEPLALVVEDDDDQNVIFTAALEQAGYTVKSIHNGFDARKFLADCTPIPTMIILDLHMPGVTGDVLLKEIRADERLKDVRVIVATSDSSYVASLQFSAELVLLKPIGFSQLSQLARRFSQVQSGAEGQ